MRDVFGRFGRAAALGLVAALWLAGCLASPNHGTTMAVNPGDLGKLSGQWEGTFTTTNGRTLPAGLQIHADGTYALRAEAYSHRGVTQVKDDKLVLVPDPAPGPGATFRTASATLQMLPGGAAVLAGTGAGESGAFHFDMRRVGRSRPPE